MTANDEQIAAYRDVGKPDVLRARGVFVAEGRLVVDRLIREGRFSLESVLVTPAARTAMAETLAMTNAPVLVCEPDALRAVTGFDFHRGCLALARRPASGPALDAFLPARRLLALEGVGNPDNVGGLFRVALALGAEGIVLDAGAGDPLYRKAIRTSMGAVLRVPFTRVASLTTAVQHFRTAGFTIVALTPAADAAAIGAVAPRDKMVLMLGAEGSGLTPECQASADLRVRIPIEPAADSLNVAVAAAVALHALRR